MKMLYMSIKHLSNIEHNRDDLCALYLVYAAHKQGILLFYYDVLGY